MTDFNKNDEILTKLVEVACYNCDALHMINLEKYDPTHYFNLYERCQECGYVFSFDVETQYIARSFAAQTMN